ncbi:MAG: T9SS type A sorting domain-containing protein [Bacteroidetes bacterium]|nr:T9SS type A sorting domain-containing protein [Bacteroidota bacterium]MBK9526002.1 T9SS type A sorting domain-containing protein [Bacteroidota bacterium]MBP6401775.1 T9SS type A sorting domain-containing protein [Bacteroidia bacterium]MBP6648913.1 T9SS type A sorting domain-containing protein [Bacteroidia bacterium]
MKKKLLFFAFLSCFSILNAQTPIITSPSGIVDLCGTTTTVNITASPSGAISYAWYRMGCILPPVASGQSFLAESGDWYCVATWPGGLQSSSAPIRVRALLGYNTVIMPFQSGPVCSSTGITLTVGPGLCMPGNFWNSYQWMLNAINIPGATSASFNPTASGSYSCRVSNSCGSVEAFGSPITIVSPLTSTVVSVNAACGILSVPNVSSNSYQWLKSGVVISGASSFQYTIPAGQSGSYACRISNVCNTITTAAVTAAGITALTISANGSLSFCQGGSVDLTASYSAANYTFQWKNNGVLIAGATGQTYTATNSGSYTVTASSASCTFTSAATVLTVNPIPSVSFSGLAASYTTLSPTATLTGSPAGGVFSGPGISGNTFNPATVGVGGPYTISYAYTSPAGCSASQSQTTTVTAGYNCSVPQSITATNITGTKALIGWSGSSAPQFKLRYRKSGSSTYTYKTFTWVPGNNSYLLTGLKRNTNYQVSIQALCTSGNSAYSSAITFRTTSASTRMKENEDQVESILADVWTIYPNPTQTFLTITNKAIPEGQEIQYQVYDLTGRIQQSGILRDNSIQVAGMERGIYLLKLIYGNKMETIRFLKD